MRHTLPVLFVLLTAPLLAQTPAVPEPTETIAPNIPGVVKGGTRVELVATGLRGTEGPIAGADGTLLFTEQQASVITRLDHEGRRTTFLENTGGSNGLTFDHRARLLGTQPEAGRIVVFTPSLAVLADNYEGTPLRRPNDLVADAKGGVYFTDPGPNPPPGEKPGPAAVYYVRPDRTMLKIADDITRPNGITLSPDEKVLYVADTLGTHVVAFDVRADGSVANRRAFAALEGVAKTEIGVRSGADGLAVDADGRLYVASAAGVQVFAPQGKHLGTIPIGVANGPQNLAFAGPGKRTLYVVGRGAAWKVPMLARGPQHRAK